jgi:hypothetical protein
MAPVCVESARASCNKTRCHLLDRAPVCIDCVHPIAAPCERFAPAIIELRGMTISSVAVKLVEARRTIKTRCVAAFDANRHGRPSWYRRNPVRRVLPIPPLRLPLVQPASSG